MRRTASSTASALLLRAALPQQARVSPSSAAAAAALCAAPRSSSSSSAAASVAASAAASAAVSAAASSSSSSLLTRAAASAASAAAAAAKKGAKKGGEWSYPSGTPSQFVDDLQFIAGHDALPTTRIMDEAGEIVSSGLLPAELAEDEGRLRALMEGMVQLSEMDKILYDVQRQGRISFYMTSTGEEAAQFGSAAAIEPQDVVYSQYREPGVLMHRGFTLEQFCHQCYSNAEDLGKGRQMPVHYGSKELNFQTISSPLTTQLPQAAGAAYKFKQNGEKDKAVICYFGEGAASEGDFHAALNFAATLGGPVIFFCRNNGYAISTPTKDQFAGDGIGARGPAYGIQTVRCDGNDLFAVYAATKAARKIAVEQQVPVLIEAMTYRMGHHSTSDDASRYRGTDEPESWTNHGPIDRLGKYMEAKGWWDAEQEAALRKDRRKKVLAALKNAETTPKPPISDLFTDVYDVVPPHLLEQRDELAAHLAEHAEAYGLDAYEGGASKIVQ